MHNKRKFRHTTQKDRRELVASSYVGSTPGRLGLECPPGKSTQGPERLNHILLPAEKSES